MKQDYETKCMKGNYDATRTAGTLLQIICHSLAAKSGWWHHDKKDLAQLVREPQERDSEARLAKALVAEKLCLIHSEVSEAMEGFRKGLQDDHLPHRSMLEVELADAVIRIADLAGAMGLDLGGAIAEKLQYNQSREDHRPEARAMEGGKKF